MSEGFSDGVPTQQSARFFWPLIFLATIAIGGVAVYKGQLQTSRPPVDTSNGARDGNQIEAYLWEDPLDVVRVATSKESQVAQADRDKKQNTRGQGGRPGLRINDRLDAALYNDIRRGVDKRSDGDYQPDTNSEGVHILIASIRDGVSAEDKEWRIRSRFALIKALHAHGYRSDDPERISFGFLPKSFYVKQRAYRIQLVNSLMPSEEIEALEIDPISFRLKALPYEWFTYDSLHASSDPIRTRVLIIWVPDRLLRVHPLASIGALVRTILHKPSDVHFDRADAAEVDDAPAGDASLPRNVASLASDRSSPDAKAEDITLPLRLAHETKGDRLRYDKDVRFPHGGKVRIDVLGPTSSGTLKSILDDIDSLSELLSPKKAEAGQNGRGKPGQVPAVPDLPNDPAPKADSSAELPDRNEDPTARTKPNRQGPIFVSLKEPESRSLNDGINPRVRELMENLEGIKFYSPWSTVEPNLFYELEENYDEDDSSIENRPRELADTPDINFEFVRTIGSDGVLAGELIAELQRRGVRIGSKDNPEPDRITLICEEETFYGRAFRVTFAAAYDALVAGELPNDLRENFYWALVKYRKTNKLPDAIKSYGYIRGVDGFTAAGVDKKTDGRSQALGAAPLPRQPEMPIGKGQLDYARRLASRIYEDHARSGIKPKAIGIAGSDVYDKLLLLQALRPHFPDAIFFTTDIDARLFHYEQYRWTRNLVVASHYGLKLDDEFLVFGGDGSPVFRDNYQTALYLSGCVALSRRLGPQSTSPVSSEEYIDRLIVNPRLFEIGRNGAVDISTNQAKVSVHPPRPNPLPFYDAQSIVGLIIFVVFALLLTYHASSRFRQLVKLIGELRLAQTIVCLLIVASIGVFWLGLYDHKRLVGEPFSFAQSVSIWPTIIIRMIAFFMCIAFIAKARHELLAKAQDIAYRFKLDPSRDEHFQISATSLLNLVPRWLSYRKKISIDFWTAPAGNQGTARRANNVIDAEDLWVEYKEYALDKNRWNRVISMSLTYVVFCLGLHLVWGFPITPYRGDVAYWTDKIVNCLSFFGLVTLTFYVVDATRLCQQFVDILAQNKTAWSQATQRSDVAANRNLHSDDLAEWLDIEMLADWTRTVSKLITYPFVVLLVLIVARSTFFDNWSWSFPIVIAYLLILLYALNCALSLRKRAEKSRRKAIDRLRKYLLSANSKRKRDERRASQLGVLINQIQSLRRGAFSPLHEHPILGAILIPSGGITIMTLWNSWSTFF